jgi:predicted DNA-binding protein
MATSKTRAGRSVPQKRVVSAGQSKPEKPVALTLKLDSKTYVRLCTLGAKERRTNQDIMREAVEQYLDRVGA